MDLNQLIKKYSYQKEKICSLHLIFVYHCLLLTGNIFHDSNFLRIPKPVYLHLHIDLCSSWSMRLLAISAAHRTTCQNREKKKGFYKGNIYERVNTQLQRYVHFGHYFKHICTQIYPSQFDISKAFSQNFNI